MRRLLLLLTLVGAVLLATTGVVLAQNTGADPSTQESGGKAPLQKEDKDSIKGQYIVVLKDDVSSADTVAKKHAASEGFTPDRVYEKALKGYAAKLSDAKLDKVRSKPEVKFVSFDHRVDIVQKTDRTRRSSAQGSTSKKGADAQSLVPITSGDSAPTGVRRIGAATSTQAAQASNVGVAVIDTGIDLSHPDLQGTALNGTNCVSSGAQANDDNGHGSHVSGTIGAKNNGSGVEGVAPGTTLYAAKVLNAQGSGTWSQVICGVEWVTNNTAAKNIKVASMSLGGGGSSDTNCGNSNGDALHQAICNSTNAGVTYVVAAGNSGANEAGFVPAAYPEVLAVTAASDSDGMSGGTGGAPTCRTGEQDDYYATFSNYAGSSDPSAQNHTVAGPGVCIYSTWMNGGYNTISGTSMATPHVSGTVALCFGNGGTPGPCAADNMTPAQIIQKIRSDAQAHATSSNGFAGDPFHSVTGKYFGYLAYASDYANGSSSGGGGTTPPPTSSPTAPNAPTGLVATRNGAKTNQSISLTWTDNSTNEDSFIIERSVNDGAWSKLTTVSANVTTYTDKPLNGKTKYSYRVIAHNSVGDSAPSNTASVSTR